MTSTIRFGELTIGYDERVLEPRPWTERQSRWAADLLGSLGPGPVLELCAGVGHIGLLAVLHQPRDLVLVDLNPAACELARANVSAAGLGDRVEVREGGFETVLRADERFALIIADPPWVPSAQTSRFPEDPLIAIDGGADGLGVARSCVRVIARHLAAEGAALLQLGTLEQVESLATLAREELGLRLGEVRPHADRGVLVELVRGASEPA